MAAAPSAALAALTEALAYVKAHGGGTIGVSSQQGAASAIIESGADVAGIGGFSGRERGQRGVARSRQWPTAYPLGAGRRQGGGMPQDGRNGSQTVMEMGRGNGTRSPTTASTTSATSQEPPRKPL